MIIKKKNNFIYDIHEPKPMEYHNYRCIECGRPMSDRHHLLFNRANRPKSEKYGLTVPLCRECHDRVHFGHRPEDKALKEKLQQLAQKVFEKHIGTREDFMKEFHKNYLWKEEEDEPRRDI